MHNEITIDAEFKALIPPLGDSERSQLEENIKQDGCRDPLVVWDNVLLDGHNRHEICTRLGVEYNVKMIDLPDRQSALDWIDANQLGRRNLTPEQMSLLRGRIYNRSKKARGAPEGNSNRAIQSGQNVQIEKQPTHESLGERFGVSGKTVQRDGQFADSINTLKDHVPDIEERVMSGEVKRQQVREAAKEPERAAEALSHNHRAQGTGENEWYTPDVYLDAAREVLGGFDLDPASSDTAQEKIKAAAYYTKDDDGLVQPWHGSVWLNPPYSQPLIMHFIERVCGAYHSGEISSAIVLTHNYTDTKWFQKAAESAEAICFTRGRIKFYSPRGEVAAPTQGQAFFYFGECVIDFAQKFGEFGFVVVKP